MVAHPVPARPLVRVRAPAEQGAAERRVDVLAVDEQERARAIAVGHGASVDGSCRGVAISICRLDAMRAALLVTTALGVALAAPAAAQASIIVDRATSGEQLVVDASGRAQISWVSRGARRTGIVTGSKLAYPASGVGAQAATRVPATVPFAVAQYRLPNGEQFALQKMARLGQFGKTGPVELHFARWRGALPELRLGLAGSKLCGQASYHGKPILGKGHTAGGNPTDALGRNVYLDVGRGVGSGLPPAVWPLPRDRLPVVRRLPTQLRAGEAQPELLGSAPRQRAKCSSTGPVLPNWPSRAIFCSANCSPFGSRYWATANGTCCGTRVAAWAPTPLAG